MAKQRARCKLLADAEAASSEEDQNEFSNNQTNLLNNLSTNNRKTLNNLVNNGLNNHHFQMNLINNGEVTNYGQLNTLTTNGNKLIQSIVIKQQENAQEDQLLKKVFHRTTATTTSPNAPNTALINMQLIQLENGQLGVTTTSNNLTNTKNSTIHSTFNNADLATNNSNSNLTNAGHTLHNALHNTQSGQNTIVHNNIIQNNTIQNVTSISNLNNINIINNNASDKKESISSINQRTTPSLLNTFFLNNCTPAVNSSNTVNTNASNSSFLILNTTSGLESSTESSSQSTTARPQTNGNSIFSISMDQQQFAKLLNNQQQMNSKIGQHQPFTAILYSTVNSSSTATNSSTTQNLQSISALNSTLSNSRSGNTSNNAINNSLSGSMMNQNGHQQHLTSLNTFKNHHTISKMPLVRNQNKLVNCLSTSNLNEKQQQSVMMTNTNFTSVDLKKVNTNLLRSSSHFTPNQLKKENIQQKQNKGDNFDKEQQKIKSELMNSQNCLGLLKTKKLNSDFKSDLTRNDYEISAYANQQQFKIINNCKTEPTFSTNPNLVEDELINQDQLSIDKLSSDNGYGSFDDGRTSSSNMDCLSTRLDEDEHLENENMNENLNEDQLMKESKLEDTKLDEFNNINCTELDCTDLNANDVLFNLDTFDMLNEFNNLDYDLNNNHLTSNLTSNLTNFNNYGLNLEFNNLNNKIEDVCSPSTLYNSSRLKSTIKSESFNSETNCDNQSNQANHNIHSNSTTANSTNNQPANQLQSNNRILSQLLTSKTSFSLLNEQKSSDSPKVIKLIDYNPKFIYAHLGDELNWMFILIDGLLSSNSYQIKFDQLTTVHGLLIASNVIRCRIPSSSNRQSDKIKFQILENGKLVIDNLEFEFMKQEVTTLKSSSPELLNKQAAMMKSIYEISERELKYCLLEKLCCLASSITGNSESIKINLNDFENNVIKVLDKLSSWQDASKIENNLILTSKIELDNELDKNEFNLNSLTILHLASALGYTNLIFNLLELKDVQVNQLFDDQINLKSLDNFNSTPLHWSMARGHEASSKLLISLCCESCNLLNKTNKDTFKIAEAHGFRKLASLAKQWLVDCLRTNASLRLDLNLEDEVDQLDHNLKHHLNNANSDSSENCEFKRNEYEFDCSPTSTISNLNSIENYASKFSLDELICDNSLINCDNLKNSDLKMQLDVNIDKEQLAIVDKDIELNFIKLFLAKLIDLCSNQIDELTNYEAQTNDQEYNYLPNYKQLFNLINLGKGFF